MNFHITHRLFVGNKPKGRISKRVFQENKAHQMFRKTNVFYPLITTQGSEMFFFGKFGLLSFLKTPVLSFTLLPYYRRIYLSHNIDQDEVNSDEVFYGMVHHIMCTPPFLLKGLNLLTIFEKGAGGVERTSIFRGRLL